MVYCQGLNFKKSKEFNRDLICIQVGVFALKPAYSFTPVYWSKSCMQTETKREGTGGGIDIKIATDKLKILW